MLLVTTPTRDLTAVLRMNFSPKRALLRGHARRSMERRTHRGGSLLHYSYLLYTYGTYEYYILPTTAGVIEPFLISILLKYNYLFVFNFHSSINIIIFL